MPRHALTRAASSASSASSASASAFSSAAAAVVALAFLARSAGAAITLDQNFDTGSLNVAASTVAGSVVNLAPRRFAAATPGDWTGTQWWWHFSAGNVAGLTPSFTINAADAFQPYTNSMRVVYSYDRVNWQYFSHGSLGGGGAGGAGGAGERATYTFSNATPFTSNTVYVARTLPYTMARTDAYVAALAGNPFVAPTPSADASRVIGRTPGTAGGGYVDDLGRAVAAQNLYAFQVTDTSVAAAAKKKVVLVAGNHAGEGLGNLQLQGFVDFLLSAAPQAVALRKKAVFFVYPQVDPEGRAAGYFRSTPQNPGKNHNRVWDDPAGFTGLAAIQQAMKADTGQAVDYFFDFHNYGQPSGGTAATGYQLYDTNDRTPAHDSQAFREALLAYLPQLGIEWTPPAGFENYADGWAAWSGGAGQGGLNAKLAFTSEVAEMNGMLDADYMAVGRKYAMALNAVLPAPVPEPGVMGLAVVAGVGLLARRRR